MDTSQITPEMARAELTRRNGGITPEMAKAELSRREHSDTLSQIRTATGGIIEGVPIVGPMVRGGIDRAAAATIAGPMDWMMGETSDDVSYDEALRQIQQGTQEEKAENPAFDIGSQIAGSFASTAGLGTTTAGAKLLGLTGKSLGQRARNMATSGLGISAADTMVRGGTAEDIATSGAIGGTVGGAIPVVGHGLRTGYNALKNSASSILNPAKEAQRRVATSIADDMAQGDALSMDDIAAARKTGQPLTVGDIGGEATRALARSAANNSPAARSQMAGLPERFGQQYERATDFVKGLVGGKADDVAYKETIRTAASRANQKNYQGAFTSVEAENVWTPTLQKLTQSPTVVKAIKETIRRSGDKIALVDGARHLKNPFIFTDDGMLVPRSGIRPTLEFWDEVKKNLDDMHLVAKRKGKNQRAFDFDNLRKVLIAELDRIVPQYAIARAGAAAAFGAEDAIEAGRKAVNIGRQNKELLYAVARMKKAELEGFRIGYASELVDRIRQSGERVDVINRVFGSPEARQKLEIILGKSKSDELEAFIRIENAMKLLQNAVGGNSTTARQLAEMGLGGSAGFYFGGDWQSAALGAGAGFGGRVARDRFGKELAKVLMSQDPNDIEKLTRIVAKNKTHMHQLRQLEKRLSAAVLGSAVSVTQGIPSQ